MQGVTLFINLIVPPQRYKKPPLRIAEVIPYKIIKKNPQVETQGLQF